MSVYCSLTGGGSDILLNVFLAIAVDNLADADALGKNDSKYDVGEGDVDAVVYEVRARNLTNRSSSFRI